MKTITLKMPDKEIDYLKKIAKDNKLHHRSGEGYSLDNAVRELIKWCAHNDIDINKKSQSFDEDLRKMIEQIHLTIPNLMYLSRIHGLLGQKQYSDEEVQLCKQKTIDYLNKTCGDFQTVNYKTLHVTMSNIGLKQVPTSEEHSQWS